MNAYFHGYHLVRELTVNLDGVFWHSLPTEADMQLNRRIFPRAGGRTRAANHLVAGMIYWLPVGVFRKSAKEGGAGNMKLSVIVPAYNEESMIGDTLACARAAVAPHELFVVNHYSTDGTVEIAARYAQVLTPAEAMTRGAALNYAASVATGDVLLFLHADTRLPTDAATSIEAALDNPRVIGGAFQLRLDDSGWAARLISGSVNLRSSLLHIFFGDQAMFVRREIFARAGGYQDWSVMEDLEIVGRLQRFGRLKILDTEVVTSARRHRSNGWLKTIATIWMMSLLTRLGVPGQVMIRLYKPQR